MLANIVDSVLVVAESSEPEVELSLYYPFMEAEGKSNSSVSDG